MDGEAGEELLLADVKWLVAAGELFACNSLLVDVSAVAPAYKCRSLKRWPTHSDSNALGWFVAAGELFACNSLLVEVVDAVLVYK